jgi:cytoskeletal protein RodZ
MVSRSEAKRRLRMVATLGLAAMLAACAGTDMASLVTPAAAPEPTAAAAPGTAAAPAAEATSPAPPARARAARSDAAAHPAPATPAPAPTHGLTKEEINTECWMRADTERRLRDIDARLAYVNRCVAERSKGL